MDTGVAKVDVHHVRTPAAQDGDEPLIFTAINQGRLSFHELHPALTKQVAMWPRHHLKVREWESPWMLHPFRHDKGPNTAQGRHLAIHMQHLRLEKRTAVA